VTIPSIDGGRVVNTVTKACTSDCVIAIASIYRSGVVDANLIGSNATYYVATFTSINGGAEVYDTGSRASSNNYIVVLSSI
jgi:hypothetical protein